MESRTKFTSFQKNDAFSVAQGLFESKVSVQRPPSIAQKATYNTTRSGVTRPIHTTKNIKKGNSLRTECIVQQPTYPLWKPFTGERSLGKSKKRSTEMTVKKDYPYNNSLTDQEIRMSVEKPRLPKGVDIFEPWINEDQFHNEWIGVDASPNCFILIPPCDVYDCPVECLPPLQKADEPLLQREVKKYIPPKILHNYNYSPSENLYQCDHKRKRDTKIDQRESVQRLRTSEIIKQEIEDLEQLLQGYGNPNSSSIVNRYQYEITKLKEMVIETLREFNISGNDDLPPEKLKTSVIQGDLFEFIARHDEVIAAIKEKRNACVRELARLEQELYSNR